MIKITENKDYINFFLPGRLYKAKKIGENKSSGFVIAEILRNWDQNPLNPNLPFLVISCSLGSQFGKDMLDKNKKTFFYCITKILQNGLILTKEMQIYTTDDYSPFSLIYNEIGEFSK